MKYIVLIIIVGLIFVYLNRNSNNAKAATENIAKGNMFLLENKKEEGVVETASGLQYKVLHKGDGNDHPTAKSKVTVHYHGTLLDGRVFDSSVDRGEPLSFGLNRVIPGWTEGVQLMKVGDKYRFYIPSELGYKNQSVGIIEPGALLVFDKSY